MIIVRQEEAWKNYRVSNEPTAKNWEWSLLWHGGKAKEPRGINGPFTALNRTPKNVKASYPPITLNSGTMGYYILSGEFICNDDVLRKDDYVKFEAGSTMQWSSDKGGEMLILLKGELIWHRDIGTLTNTTAKKKIVKYKDALSNYYLSKRAKDWEVTIFWEEASNSPDIRAPFSGLNRIKKDCKAEYPPITLRNGTMEYYVLCGEFNLNNEILREGDYAIFEAWETMYVSTAKGGEFFLNLNGELKK